MANFCCCTLTTMLDACLGAVFFEESMLHWHIPNGIKMLIDSQIPNLARLVLRLEVELSVVEFNGGRELSEKLTNININCKQLMENHLHIEQLEADLDAAECVPFKDFMCSDDNDKS